MNDQRFQRFLKVARPKFPPNFSIEELLEKSFNVLERFEKVTKVPNSWFVYRMVILKELKTAGYSKRRNMREFSKVVSQLWKTEPNHVKKHYKNLYDEAKKTYAEKCQILHPYVLFVDERTTKPQQEVNPQSALKKNEDDLIVILPEPDQTVFFDLNDSEGNFSHAGDPENYSTAFAENSQVKFNQNFEKLNPSLSILNLQQEIQIIETSIVQFSNSITLEEPPHYIIENNDLIMSHLQNLPIAPFEKIVNHELIMAHLIRNEQYKIYF